MTEPTKEQIGAALKWLEPSTEYVTGHKPDAITIDGLPFDLFLTTVAALRAALEVKPDHIGETNKMVDESAIRADHISQSEKMVDAPSEALMEKIHAYLEERADYSKLELSTQRDAFVYHLAKLVLTEAANESAIRADERERVADLIRAARSLLMLRSYKRVNGADDYYRERKEHRWNDLEEAIRKLAEKEG